MMEKLKGAGKQWERYKYALAAALAGIVLLSLPAAAGSRQEQDALPQQQDLAGAMEEILGAISGVGQVRVLLSVDSDGERELARDTEVRYSGSSAAPEDYARTSSTVLLEGETGDESLVVRTRYPTYRGALVVCTGGDDPKVRLTVTNAVMALTGLTSDCVTVAKWQ